MSELITTKPEINDQRLPEIIQGGMGVGVSNWEMAGEVAFHGEFGVVSGTGIAEVMVRRLQDGDQDTVRVLGQFPDQDLVGQVITEYFDADRAETKHKYKKPLMFDLEKVSEVFDEEKDKTTVYHRQKNQTAELLNMLGAWVEVTLAKEKSQGNGKIGINFLRKLDEPTLPTITGAMLAGADAILMGAGIPMEIPKVIDDLAAHQPTSIKIDVKNSPRNREHRQVFDFDASYPQLKELNLVRPKFFAIISSHVLARTLVSRASVPPDGFIVEHSSAGGHNAPPRGKVVLNETGEPVYGQKDIADLEKIAALGLPFWLAGSYTGPEKLAEALEAGAAGVQIATVFAYSKESPIKDHLKRQIFDAVNNGQPLGVFTDPLASPTGYPFKVVDIPSTLSEEEVYEKRGRICDIGYLRHKYEDEDGEIVFRCPAEPVARYLAKGGDEADTEGRKCLCNALLATIDMPQLRRSGEAEPAIVTSGDDIGNVIEAMFQHKKRTSKIKGAVGSYTVKDVLDYQRSTPLEKSET